MNRLRRILLSVLLTAALGAAVTAASSPGAVARHHPGGHTATSSAEQWGDPVNQRTGGWTCIGSLASGSVAGSNPNEYCIVNHGCWTWVNAGVAEWESAATFGCGATVIGHIKLMFTARLNGRQSTSRPVRFTPTTLVEHLLLIGNRYDYDSHDTAGKPVRPSVYKNYLYGVVHADHQAVWPDPGYETFQEHPVGDGAVFSEWKWVKPGYGGHWYAYSKSIHYYFRHNNAHYFKAWKKHGLGKEPSGGGWQGSTC
jgi:hypothetical protein